MVQRTPGRFPYYEVTGDAIREVASAPGTQAGHLARIADEFEADERRVLGQIEGAIATEVRKNPAAAKDTARNLALNGLFAVGCLNRFAEQVDRFDRTVNTINLQCNAQVTAAQHDPDMRSGSGGQSMQQAVNGILSRFRHRWLAAERDLDNDAIEVAAELKSGVTAAKMKDLVRQGLLPLAVLARFPQIQFTAREIADLKKLLIKEGRLDTFFAAPPWGTSSTEIKYLLDLARAMGLPPKQYAEPLQRYYVTLAAEKAGIDMTTWDVSLGAPAVASHYEGTYRYYASLYLENPDFKWAGMAAMIGPSFAAGFEDLESFKEIANALSHVKGGPWGSLSVLSELTEADLHFYQETFLQMQKDIFVDASMMHEAYGEGGLASIRELREAGLLGDPAQSQQAVNAWTKIDTGSRTNDQSLLESGNRDLLYREQRYTIDDQYQSMRNHPVTGEAMTYVMGVVGKPSIPDTQTLGELNGVSFNVDASPIIPGVQGATVNTNIPEGNIADFDTRWNLIEEDTLPTYLNLLNEDPDQVREILTTDVRTRIDENGLVDRTPEILASISGGDVDWRWR